VGAIAEALAAVHAVEWRRAGLGFLVSPPAEAGAGIGSELGTPLGTDLARWRPSLERSGLASHPLVLALAAFLRENEPHDARHTLLHGDPNPGNYLLDGGRVTAVVDWELAAIGDPRSDLGFYAALCTVFGGATVDGGRTPLSEAYAAVTGRVLRDLDYYEAVGLYKMAPILAGWAGSGSYGYALDVIARRLSWLFGPRWAG
jgi:aminoglycoside phosphotransferase (APT) family kinase protein